ncbi:hypothetical protein C1645_730688 [Glomus cerebriforme]|uniref:Uncharacterized protein n=1 Tax=Glomus cerebriforme TaxID=658196 RepID=A0A397TS74_9GLOM|nr:hypothetical protein C1645_730688 [Glomus cerebriforme]
MSSLFASVLHCGVQISKNYKCDFWFESSTGYLIAAKTFFQASAKVKCRNGLGNESGQIRGTAPFQDTGPRTNTTKNLSFPFYLGKVEDYDVHQLLSVYRWNYRGELAAIKRSISLNKGGWDGNLLPLKEVTYYSIRFIYMILSMINGIQKVPAAVLGLDGKLIIIYGGADDELAVRVLDLTNYNWYTPKVSGNNPNFTFRGWEAVINVVGKYMIVYFGLYDQKLESDQSDLLLLDISNDNEYIWTTKFDLNPVPPEASGPPIIIKIILPIFGCILLILLTIGCFFLHKFYKNKRMASKSEYSGKQPPETLNVDSSEL